MIHSPGWKWSKYNGAYNYNTIPEKGSLWNLANGDFKLKTNTNHFYFDDNGLDIKVNKL
jgi:hypothetical protein